jgi:hypothetical protein
MSKNVKLVKTEIPIVVSSNPAIGAFNLSITPNSFDSFRVDLDQPIHIPRNARNCVLEVLSTSIWNNEPNIITGVNDRLRVTGPDTLDVLTVYDLTIPQGSYSVSELNQRIQIELSNAGAKTSPDPIISLTPDEATQKIEIRIFYTGAIVDFNIANSCWEILGFNNTDILTATFDGESFLAPNEASFNVINYYLISSNLVSQGLRFNNTYRQIINQTNIDVRPNSQIVSEPFNPSRIECPELVGQVRSNFDIRLLKDDFTPANTRSEYFSVRMSLSYLEPIEF